MNVNKNGTPDRHQNAGGPGAVPEPGSVPPHVVMQGQTQSPSPDQCSDYVMDDQQLEVRIRNYLAKMPAAVSGCDGHDALFAAAQKVVLGFHIEPDIATALLMKYYNPRCVPPWQVSEVEHKCNDALDNSTETRERGWLLKGNYKLSQTSGISEVSETVEWYGLWLGPPCPPFHLTPRSFSGIYRAGR